MDENMRHTYLIFIIYFTQPQFEAKKFYTWKHVNLRQKSSRDKTISKILQNDNDEPNPWKAQLYEHFGPSQQRPWKDYFPEKSKSFRVCLIVTMLPPDESWVQCLPLYPEEKKGQNI